MAINPLQPVSLRFRGTLLVPTGSLAGSKLKLLPMCAKSVCQRPKRFALATKGSQGHDKAFEVVVSYHLPLLIGFVRFRCSSSELHASEFEIS